MPPTSPPLVTSVMYHYESLIQMQSLHENEVEVFTSAFYGHPNEAALTEKILWMEGVDHG